jgi:hypothetical protein
MLSSFGDESTDETKRRVFAVACVVASEDEWKKLRKAWIVRVASTHGNIPFHATDCDSDHGHYAVTEHLDNKALYRDLVTILAASGAWGYGAALDLSAFGQIYPDVAEELCYHKAFFENLRFVTVYAKERFNESIKFTFDSRAESNYSAGVLYKAIVTDKSAEYRHDMFDEVTFTPSTEEPRIQIGDLLARETMKELDNQVAPVKRKRRRSMDALVATGRFQIDLFGLEYFQEMREKTRDLEKGDAEFNRRTYAAWLTKCQLPDIPTNRLRFLEFVNRTRGQNR